ncbi:MAG: hypothetical protein ACRC2S_14655 [Waterburya sp.]
MMNQYCSKVLCSFSSLGLTNLLSLAIPTVGWANPVELQAFHIAHPTIAPNNKYLGK